MNALAFLVAVYALDYGLGMSVVSYFSHIYGCLGSLNTPA